MSDIKFLVFLYLFHYSFLNQIFPKFLALIHVSNKNLASTKLVERYYIHIYRKRGERLNLNTFDRAHLKDYL